MPGAAALVARGDDVEIGSAGELEPDSIVRIASMTKPITAAAVMLLVDEGLVSLDDPIARWLPELASPRVVRTPESPIDDVVPAARAITVEDVLTFRAGWGFPSDFSLPAVVELFQKLPVFGPRETPDEWLGDARAGADAPPARRGVALQHLLRHPGRPRRRGSRAGRCRSSSPSASSSRSGWPTPASTSRRRSSTGCRRTTAPSAMPIDDRLWTEPPIFPSGRRRPRLDARRLAPLRADAARGRRRPRVRRSRCA